MHLAVASVYIALQTQAVNAQTLHRLKSIESAPVTKSSSRLQRPEGVQERAEQAGQFFVKILAYQSACLYQVALSLSQLRYLT